MKKTLVPIQRAMHWALALVAGIGLASTVRAQTVEDIPLTWTTYIDSYYDTQNMGGTTTMKNVVNAPGHNAEGSSVTRSLLALPSITIPAGEEIQSITLNLYCTQYNVNGDTTTNWSMVAYPLTQGFVQGNGNALNNYNATGATWLTYDGTHCWATPGGDFDSSVSIQASATPVIGSWTSFNLTNIWTNPSLAVQKRELQNYGVELTVSPENPKLVPANEWVTESFANDNYTPPPASPGPYLAVTFVPLPAPTTAAWNDVSGNWSNTANWNPGTPLSTAGAVAEFLGNATQNRTATLDSPVTLGTIIFDNTAHSYTLAGSGSNTITMSSSSGAAAITVSGGNHQISAPLVLASDTTVTVANAADTLTLGGVIAGSGSLVKAGSGKLTLGSVNTYQGNTTISAGTLVTNGDANTLPATTALLLGPTGVLDLYGNPQTVASLSGSAGSTITDSYCSGQPGTIYMTTLTVSPTAGATTFAGNIAESTSATHDLIALTLSGSGRLILSGSNTYSGGTTVSGGTLELTSAAALASTGNLLVASGGNAVLDNNLTGAATQTAALAAASAVTSDNSPELSLLGNSQWAALTPQVQVVAQALSDFPEDVRQSLTYQNSPALNMAALDGAVGGLATVPEPGTLALLAAGAALAAIEFGRRYRAGRRALWPMVRGTSCSTTPIVEAAFSRSGNETSP